MSEGGTGNENTGSLGCSIFPSNWSTTEQAWRRGSAPYARNIFKLPKWNFILTIIDKIHMQYLLVMIT